MATQLQAKPSPPPQSFFIEFNVEIDTPKYKITKNSWYQRNWASIELHLGGKKGFSLFFIEKTLKTWLAAREKFFNDTKKDGYPLISISRKPKDPKEGREIGVVFKRKQFAKMIEVGKKVLKDEYKFKIKEGKNGGKGRKRKKKDHGDPVPKERSSSS